ncbi:methylaspartate mutase [Sinorhizobium medicae]|uniref:methylaspartate mutase n=1 Tax=Sinorhizobium medicae TaxID=110321 RepID=UPI001295FD03|nr:methylaspartate mutase [Sinorhizobium medicae]MQX95949.1 methylaspartate mutase [Sinorhizobium medicae]
MSHTDEFPTLADTCDFLKSLEKTSVAQLLADTKRSGAVAVQARSGVGSHREMLELLSTIEAKASPDILTITIDSYSRLRMFDKANQMLHTNPEGLNGYPLVAHGWRRGRELNRLTKQPLDIRHGSPIADRLFKTAIASGITSFEGGGVSYNLPYAKRVPLEASLASWRKIDRLCGVLADRGIIVSREMFGTLTAVLVPPSTSLAIGFLEAISAARDGVQCLLIAFPQGGNTLQDIAALRSIDVLARQYLPSGPPVYPVLHQYMGPFPRDRPKASALILLGGLVAKLGGATKVVTKTYEEAMGIPTTEANIDGIRLTRCALARMFDFMQLDESAIAEEMHWIEREVAELIDPIVGATDLHGAIIEAFNEGRLDVPFSPSIYTQGKVIPVRDPHGAIRYLSCDKLPFSGDTRRRNREMLRETAAPRESFREIQDSIFFLGDKSDVYQP